MLELYTNRKHNRNLPVPLVKKTASQCYIKWCYIWSITTLIIIIENNAIERRRLLTPTM